jgi:hypothetical protein
MFDEFELSMEFLANQQSPKLFLSELYLFTALSAYGFNCNSSTSFFGVKTPQNLADAVTLQLRAFEAAHQDWSIKVSRLSAVTPGLESLRESGRPLASLLDDRILPLLRSNNVSAAIHIIETEFADVVAIHESIASEAAQLCHLLYSNTRSLASFGRDTAAWFIYGISGMLFGATAFISFLLIRDASLYKLELSDVAADPSSVLHAIIPKLLEIHEKQQSVMSQRSMLMAFGLVIGIQVLGIALPIRFLGGLAQQSPIANQVRRLRDARRL